MQPRINAIKWSSITKQTPNIKIGYPRQHLASLITGMYGERTGARGNDLVDGSEVKSCSRIDQLDKCNNCGLPVARLEDKCSECGSSDVKRNNDSKWLFSIRSEGELELLIQKVPHVVLIIGDYPNFEKNDYSTLRFQAFEIWPKSPRQRAFSIIMNNYYSLITDGYRHYRINHGKTFATSKRRHINGLENLWGFAKTKLRRYYGIRRTHFFLYLKEMEFRFNHRHENLIDVTMRIVKKCRNLLD